MAKYLVQFVDEHAENVRTDTRTYEIEATSAEEAIGKTKQGKGKFVGMSTHVEDDVYRPTRISKVEEVDDGPWIDTTNNSNTEDIEPGRLLK